MTLEFWLKEPRRTWLVSLLLALATLAVYWQVHAFEFTNYDEFLMILKNPIVRAGLTPEGVVWALTTSWFEYWHPVTWLSLMLDCELFGINSGCHHLVNLAFHITNSVLLFVVLRRLTKSHWRSAVVAALFALHPLHVESVAWVAERKDVLSGLFFLLTLLAYDRYVEESKQKTPKAKVWYSGALGFFTLGLMSKPMLITLPFVLLLLDYWPLKRLQIEPLRSVVRPLGRLLQEKVPFFALTAVSCVISYVGVKAGGSILSADAVPWSVRLANVPVSYGKYLLKTVYPAHLAILYPMPEHLPFWQVAVHLTLLCFVTAFVVFKLRSAPYLFVGWFIFLGMLVPTIGLVQAGFQSMADRYMYIPAIGLFVGLVWAAGEISALCQLNKGLVTTSTVLVSGVCGLLTLHQTAYWKNSLTLWFHCISVSPDNPIAFYNLGYALEVAGRNSEAKSEYQEALRLNPQHVNANVNLGTIYILENRMSEATNWLAKALQLQPESAAAHANMGHALRELGDYPGAISHCVEAIRLEPGDPAPILDTARALSALGRSEEAIGYFAELARSYPNPQTHYYYGLELLRLGRIDDAIEPFGEAVRLSPDWPDAHLELAIALSSKGAGAEAVSQYREVLKRDPGSPLALNNLSWILATHPDPSFRNGGEAVRLAKVACEKTDWKQTVFVGTLSAAYAEAGQFDKAVETSQQACELAKALGQTNLLARNQELLIKFQQGEPYRQQR